VSKSRQALLGILGLSLGAAAAGEHLYRRVIEDRYLEAVDSRQQLERQVGSILVAHERMTRELDTSRRRAQELSDAFTATRSQLEETVGRLTQETQSTQQLRLRLAAMQAQVDQLQGELAMAIEHRSTAPSAQANPVQLERVIVSDAGASNLQGRIISVNQDWKFVVIDLGWNAVRIGDTVSIFRNEALLGKARVERVQEGVCAATLLPEWNQADIRPNDLVRIL